MEDATGLTPVIEYVSGNPSSKSLKQAGLEVVLLVFSPTVYHALWTIADQKQKPRTELISAFINELKPKDRRIPQKVLTDLETFSLKA